MSLPRTRAASLRVRARTVLRPGRMELEAIAQAIEATWHRSAAGGISDARRVHPGDGAAEGAAALAGGRSVFVRVHRQAYGARGRQRLRAGPGPDLRVAVCERPHLPPLL